MKKKKTKLAAYAVCLSVLTVTAGLLSTQAININPPVFDFNDAFYNRNGVDIAKLNALAPNGRVGFDGADQDGSIEGGFQDPIGDGKGHWIREPQNDDPTRNDIRVLQTTGGFDADGDLIYYNVFSPIPDESFLLHDSQGNLTPEGQDAFNQAESFRAFLFPIQARNGRLVTEPCPPGVGPGPTAPGAEDCAVMQPPPFNRRQDNVFETTETYSCRNPLGLWLLAFVIYTDAAFNTPEGQAALAELRARNEGMTTDGTPIIKRRSEILDLEQRGFVRIVNPPGPFASQRVPGAAPRWVV